MASRGLLDEHNSDSDDDDSLIGLEILQENRYEDFATIDWLRDTSAERVRQRHLHSQAQSSALGWISKTLGDSWQGWLVVWLVGICTGIFAAAIDIVTDWISGLKLGVCTSAFWLNNTLCCWTSREDNCETWVYWTGVVDTDTDPSDASAGAFIFGYLMYVALGVLFAFYSALLVKSYAPYARGSGIPEVKTILSGFIIRRFLGGSTLVIKSLGLCLAVGSGLSLGKEGPLVHVACCIGNIFSRLFYKYRTNEAKKREIMSAAAAAGVGVAFGAPIGGVLFSLEEVSYYFPHKTMWRSFFCALTAAGTLKVWNILHTHTSTELGAEFVCPCSVLILFYYLLYILLLSCNYPSCKPTQPHIVSIVCVVALITLLFRYPSAVLRMTTSELIHTLFAECGSGPLTDTTSYLCTLEASGHFMHTCFVLMAASAFTLCVTVFTFGMPVPAGIFIPSMAAGATIGRVLGIVVNQMVQNRTATSSFFLDVCHGETQCITPGIYAVVGAAAVLGGVTRMTVSLVVIMFELTGSVDFIIPIMLSCLTSKWTADLLGGIDGIYDQHIRLRNYPFLDGKADYKHDYTAQQCMQPQPGGEALSVITSHNNTIESLDDLLEKTSFAGFPLIQSNERRVVMGYIARRELRRALDLAQSKGIDSHMRVMFKATPGVPTTHSFVDFRSCLDTGPIQVAGSTPMEIVVDMFRKIGIRYTLVTIEGNLAGIMTKKDLLKHMESVDT
ncbi:hypothetical protein SARC_08723 [Sphaeroforma arctica JP610]|uniref:CBS domain-containing protein n=1 Tax=Sphaeroforma arctica JP610 TaxID=667725 RepID=A0A0L0FPX2_9EUKA|nr:hypothetical protein SARC_08723 [Sphaeroforma arctica JP610]KNC78860.1 hypothetical protein SARC_08723 [Sphaeroforma arctica JP610]|eukprot:XP_014152762.1 hypothetical protein SARC_08723 [Sphaeroforma arctica JP610]